MTEYVHKEYSLSFHITNEELARQKLEEAQIFKDAPRIRWHVGQLNCMKYGIEVHWSKNEDWLRGFPLYKHGFQITFHFVKPVRISRW